MTTTPGTHRVAAIPGDGIGTEVTVAAQKVLDAVACRHGFTLDWRQFDWSCERYVRTGQMMPADGIDQLREYDAIFLGAVGFPGVPDHVSLWGLLIPIRRAFQQYVNLRPVRLFPGITPPLAGRGPSDIDMVIVRENCEGEYSEIGGRHATGTPHEFAVQEAVFSRHGMERVMRFAFSHAQHRGGHVTSATKSNGLIHSMPFWDQIFHEISADNPQISSDQCHIDALTARMVLSPDKVDVVVASNLFGDILSDLAAAVAGSLGIAPSGNINPERTHPSMFESVHGSAPDIAHKGIANPTAQILAGAMMLDHLGETDAAAAVTKAVEDVLGSSDVRTLDLGGTAGTVEMTEAILARLGG
ncbi:tartrate dehydrogenase [Nonomuraea sp. NPDC049129]|uniref:tartrate dehydrogenase n=1 Tax=Nonomuraea sp. NPDC049129 TaxID=3155272 RepID=UPI0033F1B4C0